MTCPHFNADDFTEVATCPNGHEGEVEFHTCSCIRGAYGTCEECEAEIHLVAS